MYYQEFSFRYRDYLQLRQLLSKGPVPVIHVKIT
jgi:hypothetical protein